MVTNASLSPFFTSAEAERLLSEFPLPNPPTKPIRLGIIGLSPFAQGSHLSAIRFLQARNWPVEVTALCDTNAARLDSILPSFPQGKAFSDAKALFDSDSINAALILTQPEVSLKLCEEAVHHGTPFFVEKPAAPSLSSLQQLEHQAAKKKVSAQVGYNRRFQLAAPLMKRAIEQNRDFDHIVARMWRAGRTEPHFYRDTMVHQLDLLLWLLGPITVNSVESTLSRIGETLPASLNILFSTERGKTVTLDVRPAVGRSIESVEVITANESYLMTYHNPDGGSEPGEYSTFRSGIRHRSFFLSPETTDPDLVNFARGFVSQLATFFRLAAGEDCDSHCSLSDAATCIRLRESILSEIRSPRTA